MRVRLQIRFWLWLQTPPTLPSPPPVDATDPKEKKKEKPQSATAGLFPTPSDSVSLGVPEMSAPSSSITPFQTSSPPLLGTLVPRFPDDAKQKALALLDSNATVTDLMNMLEATGECSGGRVAAFFGVYFPPPSTPPSSSTSVAVSENWEAQKKEMERFEKALAGLRFSTRQEVLEASKRVLEVVKGLKGVDVVEIELMQTEESGSAVVEGIAPAAGVVVPPGIVGEEVVVSPPVVHQLGVGLVKKKKRSVAAGDGGEDNKKMKV
ncbi:hypothetical protein BCR33DRAFT_219299 [Rhizoclosmatium globosum]|uniref:CUE domain-containing protein n=1 Tax=Rhizoclosmatium globosum TaxID=329046 RepID=A0A1Y2CBC3_9FUNG|nr:hypothetical protein BCR33DRAFT_219299 [Rhizoclosmatium globosum]|eukprot:ORY44328.1 hypothetical protein BCR33DRAFT_219299 [Rhizoclosmatium globosum]